MKHSSRTLRTAVILFTSSILLAGCGAIDPLRDAIIPDFSDEQLGNPMAGYMPSSTTTMAATAPSPGLAFSATRPVEQAIAAAPQQMQAPSVGLLDQAAATGVNSADAALLDAALDVSPSQMGGSGASIGLVADSLNGLLGSSTTDAGMVRAPIVSSIDGTGAGFQVLSSADALALMANGGDVIQYTATERADLQTPYFEGRADAVRGLRPTPGITAVGTSPAVAVSVPDDGPNSSGNSSDMAALPRATLRTNQAAIPIYGGSQLLAQRPTTGTFRPGYAQFRSGNIEFTLTYPSAVAIGQMYGPSTNSVAMTMRNLGSQSISFQPENLLNRFPPFEVFRWTGSVWASLTMDVAYNLDRQGIAAPVTLQPGQSTTRQEEFAKLALLPLKVDLPPTNQLAIRLRVLGQGGAFGNVDSGYLPIRVTDAGAFPAATSLTPSTDPGFVVLSGLQSIPGTIVTQ